MQGMDYGTPFQVEDVEPESWEIGETQARRWRLGKHAGALRLGVAIIEIAPGKRSTPPHAHSEEDEIFLVLEGSGLSYERRSSKKIAAHEIGVDDLIWHRANEEAHSLIAGPDGLKVLVVAEGTRVGATYLPRTHQFWLGPRWTPADSPHPFFADSEAGPLDPPEPSERPDHIRNFSDLSLEEGTEGKLAWATRDAREMGSNRLVLAHDAMPPDTHNTDLHFHSAREECWYVRGGSGIARIGDDEHELREGSFWLRKANSGVGHRIEVGPDGMDLITMGDLIPGDVCVYPEKREIMFARGTRLPLD